jgi:fatty-acyl-CoA synthase
MLGLMQSDPVNLISILIHAGRWHGDREVVTNTVEGGIHKQTYADTLARATRLASRLQQFGINQGDRIGTMGWNTHRHLESWYAISGQGAICHTINPRLFADQIDFIVNHAEDRLIFVDLTFVDLLADLLPKLPTVEAVVIMTDKAHMPDTSAWDVDVHCYEEFLADGGETFDWPVLDDNTGSSLCYTSGTTGDPKGVLYSHRGNLLHAYASCAADVFDLSARDTILMVVPMFHANSWGIAYAGPIAGAKLVLPGPHMDGASIHGLIANEAVTKAAAVPTVWNMLIAHLNESGDTLDSLKEVVIGGAAVPRAMIDQFDKKYGVEVIHAWGMTEMTPVGTVNRGKPFMDGLDSERALDVRCKQGRVPYGVDMKIADDDGAELPHDGRTFGRLLVKGPWTIASYYKSDESALDDGWFDTGDIATIDEHGYMQITDRSKDVIKSGGEWISSVDLENTAMGMPGVEMAACIGATHPKWDERPILLVKPSEPDKLTEEAIIGHLGSSIAKWQLPDAVIFVDEIPLTATGKIDKKPLRAKYENYLID